MKTPLGVGHVRALTVASLFLAFALGGCGGSGKGKKGDAGAGTAAADGGDAMATTGGSDGGGDALQTADTAGNVDTLAVTPEAGADARDTGGVAIVDGASDKNPDVMVDGPRPDVSPDVTPDTTIVVPPVDAQADQAPDAMPDLVLVGDLPPPSDAEELFDTGVDVRPPVDTHGNMCQVAADCDDSNPCTIESCTNGRCASDIAPAGVLCRAAKGACDWAETCTGLSPDCPGDAIMGAGTLCRAAVSDCDLAELCDGQHFGCGANVFKPEGTICRPATGGCDVTEACTGAGGFCPQDRVRDNGEVCRPEAIGTLCDVAEQCNGASKSCPVDGFKPEGTVCGGPPMMDGCDLQDTCAGNANVCVDRKGPPPLESEVCNGLDDTCNGQIDEGNPGGGMSCPIEGQVGECAEGVTNCSEGKVVCTQVVMPDQKPETCDGKDNDCDGETDDGNPGGGAACVVEGQVGECAEGISNCDEGTLVCTQLVNPDQKQETCDGKDNDCDGETDEGNPGGGVSCNVEGQVGECAYGLTACDGGEVVCTQILSPDEKAEECDGVDNDCDGIIDDGVKTKFYPDCDGDTYGDTSKEVESCETPEPGACPWVELPGDCLDDPNVADAAKVNPGAEYHNETHAVRVWDWDCSDTNDRQYPDQLMCSQACQKVGDGIWIDTAPVPDCGQFGTTATCAPHPGSLGCGRPPVGMQQQFCK